MRHPRPTRPRHRPRVVAALPSWIAVAATALLTACGGGGGDTGGTASGLSAADAQATAANGLQGGNEGSASIDRAFDLTQALVTANTTALTPAFRPAASRGATGARALAVPVTSLTVPCVGGGSASLAISGGTLLTQLNGQFDPGEHYDVVFSNCGGTLGLVHLDGHLGMDIVSVGGSAPVVTTATLAMTALQVTVGAGTPMGGASVTLDGQATVARSMTTTSTVTTATSHVTATRFSLATAWNGRSASFAVTDLDTVHTMTWLAGVPAGSSLAGHHRLSGTANGRTIDETVAVQGEVDFDGQGTPISGAWTSVRPDATVATTVANGVVTITVDDGSDGVVDRTWTLTPAQLVASAG